MRLHPRKTFLVLAMSALMLGAMVVPAAAEDDNGKRFAQGAFHSMSTGGFVISFGAPVPAAPVAGDHWSSVRIFGYEDGPSEGQVFCGDVWNVIVTVNFQPFRTWFDGSYATHAIDAGDPVVAEMKTPVRKSPTAGSFIQVHGTLVPPGTLSDGPHTVTQTLVDPYFVWDPPPVSFEVNDSAC